MRSPSSTTTTCSTLITTAAGSLYSEQFLKEVLPYCFGILESVYDPHPLGAKGELLYLTWYARMEAEVLYVRKLLIFMELADALEQGKPRTLRDDYNATHLFKEKNKQYASLNKGDLLKLINTQEYEALKNCWIGTNKSIAHSTIGGSPLAHGDENIIHAIPAIKKLLAKIIYEPLEYDFEKIYLEWKQSHDSFQNNRLKVK